MALLQPLYWKWDWIWISSIDKNWQLSLYLTSYDCNLTLVSSHIQSGMNVNKRDIAQSTCTWCKIRSISNAMRNWFTMHTWISWLLRFPTKTRYSTRKSLSSNSQCAELISGNIIITFVSSIVSQPRNVTGIGNPSLWKTRTCLCYTMNTMAADVLAPCVPQFSPYASFSSSSVNMSLFNPLHAKFFRVNINIYLHFMSFLHIDMTQVLKILTQVR